MARTTSELVKGIIEVEDDTIDLGPFIDTASMLVTDVCGESDYSTEKFELIERWLAAHCFATRERRAVEDKAGPVSRRYQSHISLGLNNSHYGQMALRLDTDGSLAAHEAAQLEGNRQKIGAYFIGDDNE